MVVTNIMPCIKVTKENNMSGMDMYRRDVIISKNITWELCGEPYHK